MSLLTFLLLVTLINVYIQCDVNYAKDDDDQGSELKVKVTEKAKNIREHLKEGAAKVKGYIDKGVQKVTDGIRNVGQKAKVIGGAIRDAWKNDTSD